jgi:hypothetical protein
LFVVNEEFSDSSSGHTTAVAAGSEPSVNPGKFAGQSFKGEILTADK